MLHCLNIQQNILRYLKIQYHICAVLQIFVPMQETSVKAASPRQKQIVKQYRHLLDVHLQDLRNGKALRMDTISNFAAAMHIHPRHLSNTIHEVTGTSACDIYEYKILALAQDMLANTDDAIADIAIRLDYDPSNFTKFFKKYGGVTPKQYRNAHRVV